MDQGAIRAGGPGGSGPGGGSVGGPAGGPGPDPAVFERNLVALCARNRRLGERLRDTPARPGLVFDLGADGAVGATLDGRRLASARRALDEAAALAGSVDPQEAATACIMGFGVGHHVRAIQERVGGRSVVVVFEPDIGLLRAVFERVDHSAWLVLGRCLIATDADDAAGLTRLMHGFEGLVALGVKIIEHAPSRARLGDGAGRFGRSLGAVVQSTRTHVVTTLVHAPVTLRNMLMNADRYASCAGITALKDACRGSVGVTVAAGPSLRKNLALLGEPGVRDRVVVIAAQTVLRPMLDAGIRPHFVTALDHHELSGRFYEGLTPEMVRGVRLVVEPKANPAILDGYPGEILCTRDKILDGLIGPGLTRDMGELAKGSTVAHLSYALARHLGCDPVVMIGQDLAFSDGQYYSAGAAIHTVWQGELNADRSLEMLEWERIARMRAFLRRVPDHRGRMVYTDEQMATYLAQFEADFQADAQRGLTVIDATEGGSRKRDTTVMTLAEALGRFAVAPRPALPDTRAEARDPGEVTPALRAHLEGVLAQVEEIGRHGERAGDRLQRVLDHPGDTRRVRGWIDEVRAMADRVQSLRPGFGLVEFVNQTGVLNRFKADRRIALHGDGDAAGARRMTVERDLRNVSLIGEAAGEVAGLIGTTIAVLDGRRGKLTRDESEGDAVCAGQGHGASSAEVFVLCDPDYSGLGVRRDLGTPVWRGRDALALTLDRVTRCRSVGRVRVLTPEPARTAGLIERAGFGGGRDGRVVVEAVDRARWRDRTRAVGLARAGAAECWRGGVGQTTVFDEHMDPVTIAGVMERHGVDACALVGADWALVDPALIDALIARHRENPERHQLTFTQATPGIAGVVLGREAARSLADMQRAGSVLGTVGGLLGYVPVRPQADPIATSLCVRVEPCVRDAGVRAIADCSPGRALVVGALERLGDRAADSSGEQSARALSGARPWATPRRMVLELCPGRLANGVFGAWKRGGESPEERVAMGVKTAHELVRAHTRAREDAVVVLDGPGDPLMHPRVLDVVRLADELGAACVQVRTDLVHEGLSAQQLVESGAGVISVDLPASDPAAYARLTGLDRLGAVLSRLGAIAEGRESGVSGLRTPWVLPRMTKCDATLEQVEGFYDRWIMAVGAAAIDPVPAWSPDAIGALPVPDARRLQIEAETVRIRSDGAVCDAGWRVVRGVNAGRDGLAAAVRALRRRGGAGDREVGRSGGRAGAAA